VWGPDVSSVSSNWKSILARGVPYPKGESRSRLLFEVQSDGNPSRQSACRPGPKLLQSKGIFPRGEWILTAGYFKRGVTIRCDEWQEDCVTGLGPAVRCSFGPIFPGHWVLKQEECVQILRERGGMILSWRVLKWFRDASAITLPVLGRRGALRIPDEHRSLIRSISSKFYQRGAEPRESRGVLQSPCKRACPAEG
jgi:hypothetical protein